MNRLKGTALGCCALIVGGSAASCDNGDDEATETHDSGVVADGGTDGGADAGDRYELSGEVGHVEGTGTECSAISDTREEGGCYGFYCGTNSNSIKAALADDAVCDTDAEVWLICDGAGVRAASDCARLHALDEDPREGMRACMRQEGQLEPFSDACLACFLDSAECAREHCLAECLAGDSAACDECREENDCTPDYYACGGLPDPQ